MWQFFASLVRNSLQSSELWVSKTAPKIVPRYDVMIACGSKNTFTLDIHLEPQGQPLKKMVGYQLDGEPNLDIGNGWKSPFPSIYKWLEMAFQAKASQVKTTFQPGL